MILSDEELKAYDIRFLMKMTITITDKDNIDRLYDSVFRAHRDVLIGRFYLPNYCANLNTENKVYDALYDYIKRTKLKTKQESIGSFKLIEHLESKFPEIEFGAIQKLVNMTLKYLYLLKKYEPNSISDICIDVRKFDCPLDSNILGELGMDDLKWTKIIKDEYKQVQNCIKKELDNEEYGNIMYDFIKY